MYRRYHDCFSFLMLILACETEEKTQPVDVVEDFVTDADGDGYTEEEGDCDDSDAHSHTIEICDGIDNNYDGQIDEEVTTVFYADGDGDGFGNSEYVEEACERWMGLSLLGMIVMMETIKYPADEICDGIDNDCNDLIDDGLGISDVSRCRL